MSDENQQQDKAPRIPRGRYRARGIRSTAQLANSSEKGTPFVFVEFNFTDEEFRGERMSWNGWLTDNAVDRTLESLRYCGWKSDDVSDLDGVDANEVELVVDHERDDKGKLRARIAFVNKIGGLLPKAPMNQDAAKAFAAKLKGKAAASRAKLGDDAGPSENAPTTGPDGKPLPF